MGRNEDRIGLGEHLPRQEWATADKRELLELYLDGMDIEMLSWHFSRKAFEIYAELTSLLFGVSDPIRDETAVRYGKRWELLEDRLLVSLYQKSWGIEQIAQELGRDVPGVAIRLINNWWVVCPREVAVDLGLNDDYWE